MNKVKILIIVSLFISGCFSNQFEKEILNIKYFLEFDNDNLKGELNKEFFLIGKMIPSFVKDLEKISISHLYKVYYTKNKPIQIELIKTKGYFYDKGKMIKKKDFSIKNMGVIKRNDEEGREVYYYNFTTGEIVESFYGIQYTEIHTFIKDDLKKIEIKKRFPNYILDRKIKFYYENNILKKAIVYEGNKIINYYIYNNLSKEDSSIQLGDKSKNIIIYNAKGINIKPNIYYTLKLKRLKKRYLKENRKEIRDSIIKLEKILNVPDLNLTLEQQYFDKIDRLNNRVGMAE